MAYKSPRILGENKKKNTFVAEMNDGSRFFCILRPI